MMLVGQGRLKLLHDKASDLEQARRVVLTTCLAWLFWQSFQFAELVRENLQVDYNQAGR